MPHGWIRYENGVPVEAIAPNPGRARTIMFLYVLLAAAIVLCMMATRTTGHL